MSNDQHQNYKAINEPIMNYDAGSNEKKNNKKTPRKKKTKNY